LIPHESRVIAFTHTDKLNCTITETYPALVDSETYYFATDHF